MKKFSIFLIVFLLLGCSVKDKPGSKSIASEWSEEGFKTPQDEAKVQTWYHWINGHISKEAVTKDLESMKEKGLGGFTLFNVSEGSPFGGVKYYSEEWWDAFIHTKREAQRLELEMSIMNGPGWSTSGGPWNTPENSMKEVVWTEKQLSGPADFKEKLSVPEPVLGLERDMKRDTFINKRYYMPRDHVRGYYKDIAVLAFPTPKGELEGEPYRIRSWWYKAGYSKMARYERDTRNAPEEEVVFPEEIIDLTDKLDENGSLYWEVPDGNWTILRVGYQPTGRSNHPAPFGGKGLEVDKMSGDAVDIHWNESVMRKVNAGGDELSKVISYVLIDSYEAGHQNWTGGFEKEFKARCGYDIYTYLPAITGRVIAGTDETEKFLWDFRKTVSDLIIENYYKRFQTLAHENGLKFAAEGYGNFGNTDDFATGEYIDIPATEFWAYGDNHHGGITKLSSSTAHIYGRKLVGAEAFTGAPAKIFETNPADIKTQGDWFYCKGVNQFWLHGISLSPYEQSPGLGLGTYGSRFGRHNTWWKYAQPWLEYQSRCQYMLQQGHPKNDILYYVGEDAPVDPELKENLIPAIPEGYDYDFCNHDMLKKLKVKEGKLVLPNGLEYAVLVVKKSEHITLDALKILQNHIQNGAVVVAYKPERMPGINSNASVHKELMKLTDEIWGECDGEYVKTNNYGKGIIYCGDAVKTAFRDIELLPDFEFSTIKSEGTGEALFSGSGFEFIHRETSKTDVYFVSNQHNYAKVANAKFRINDKLPELWDPETGEIRTAPEYNKLDDGRIQVTLRMEDGGSVFVVFRKNLTKESASDYKAPEVIRQLSFNSPWQVSFDGAGAPEKIELSEPIDLSKHRDPEVAHFSGTISYQNQIDIGELDDQSNAILDLGQVEVAAEVFVNDQSAGILWKRPFRIDITEYLKEGTNKIRVDVANLWVNRLIGDQKLPEHAEWTTNTGSTAAGMGLEKVPDWVIRGEESPTGRKAFVSWKWNHLENKELVTSGLIGPVQMLIEK